MPPKRTNKRQRDISPVPEKPMPRKSRRRAATAILQSQPLPEKQQDSQKLTKSERSDPEESLCKPVMVILPGSSGKVSKRIAEFINGYLSDHFSVQMREGKWQGWKPLGEKNIRSVLDHCPSDGVWYAMGNSFGNRVLCEMFAAQKFDNPPAGLILCGYPLYGENCSAERVSTLLALPTHSKVLAISGSNDMFISRAPRGVSLTGEKLLQSIIDTMQCKEHTRLMIVPSGGHGVLDVPAKQVESVSRIMLEWIDNFTQAL